MGANKRLHFESVIDEIGSIGEILRFIIPHSLFSCRARPFSFSLSDIVALSSLEERVTTLFALLAAVEVSFDGSVVFATGGLPHGPCPLRHQFDGLLFTLAGVDGITFLDSFPKATFH